MTPRYPVVMVEKNVRSGKGEVQWIQFTNKGSFDNAGKLIEIESIRRDITDRKRAGDSLTESEKWYRRLFNAETDAIFLLDCQTLRFLDANQAALAMYGYRLEEFIKLKAVDLSTEPDKTKKSIHGYGTKVPLRWHRKKDGTVFPVEISGSFFENCALTQDRW